MRSMYSNFDQWTQFCCTDFRLHLKDCPILPNGLPNPNIEVKRQPEQANSIKRTMYSILTRNTKSQKEEERGKRQIDGKGQKVDMTPRFYHYWGDSWGSQIFRYDEDFFTRVDVIAICFDRSRPETLHSAIYKVCIFP
jgi:hypothetical protein